MSDPFTPAGIAVRMAQEGIPVAAIGRSLAIPFADTHDMLSEALAHGQIVAIPRSDWPPGGKVLERHPTVPRRASDADVEFACRKLFTLTNLEAGFLVLLLRLDHTDKAKLHHVIETQRLRRASQPDALELTDQKMVDVMICKLRKKLKAISEDFLIKTVWGGGYYMEPAVKEKIYARLATEGIVTAVGAVHAGAVHAGAVQNDAPGSATIPG